jgi:large subunit ribosomal protein L25
MASLTLQADTPSLVQALNQAGLTTPITLTVGSAEHFVVVKQIQKHPVTGRLLHVDLFAISRTERIHTSVPIHFEGEATAAREEGALLSEDLHELMVEALPLDMPSSITVDISPLVSLESIIYAADVVLPTNVTLVTDPAAIVARIAHRRGLEAAADGAAPAAVGA